MPQGCKLMGLGGAPQLCGTTLTNAVILEELLGVTGSGECSHGKRVLRKV